jgi:hypothetical protein
MPLVFNDTPSANVQTPSVDKNSLYFDNDLLKSKDSNNVVRTYQAFPGGSNTQVQFNDGGAFGGNANFTYDATTSTLSVIGNISGTNIIGTINGYIKVPFQFNNVSPKNVAVIPANAVVSAVDVIVTTAFDDNAATLSMGTMANANLLLNSVDSKANIVGTYAAMPGQLFLSDTWVVLTITPGSSTTGSGMIVIYF